MSGLSRTPGKRVWVNSPPRVRIPLPPPPRTVAGPSAPLLLPRLFCRTSTGTATASTARWCARTRPGTGSSRSCGRTSCGRSSRSWWRHALGPRQQLLRCRSVRPGDKCWCRDRQQRRGGVHLRRRRQRHTQRSDARRVLGRPVWRHRPDRSRCGHQCRYRSDRQRDQVRRRRGAARRRRLHQQCRRRRQVWTRRLERSVLESSASADARAVR